MFYNAVAIELQSSWRKIEQAKKQYGSFEGVFRNLDGRTDPEREWQELKRAGVQLTLREEGDFPNELREIPDPPAGIYWRGELDLESERVAVVGTRRATTQGKRIAEEIGRELAQAGVVTVSGLAAGIDEAAHLGSLAGRGKTIAVMARGLAVIYPARNTGLAEKIVAQGGTLISEYPLKAEPLPYRFLERNRITSGLARATVIVEAPLKSGAIATARLAGEQGREVMVVPGGVDSFNYKGCHALIRDGARLITGPADLLQDLEIETGGGGEIELGLDEKNIFIVKAIKEVGGGLTVDKLAEMTKLDVQKLNQRLADLIIEGVVKEIAGKYYL